MDQTITKECWEVASTDVPFVGAQGVLGIIPYNKIRYLDPEFVFPDLNRYLVVFYNLAILAS